jgi:circadian clock protein KaiB
VSETSDTVARFEKALSEAQARRVTLRLYVAGMAPRSLQAIADLKQLCSSHLGEGLEVEIVDIYQQPELAAQAQIVAVPTLVREHPLPVRKLLGSLEDRTAVGRRLGLEN